VFKTITVGIALGVMTSPSANSGFLLALYALEFFVLVWYRPQNDWYANLSELITSGVQVRQYVIAPFGLRSILSLNCYMLLAEGVPGERPLSVV
jgi:hypothetical protein